jgi:SAM-dependent methyltransferase
MQDKYMSWIEFWNGEHFIYVSDRHRIQHYRLIASDIISLLPNSDSVILDVGCGEALNAEEVASNCRELYLCDAAPTIREKLKARFGDSAGIRVISPEEVTELPARTFDFIIAHSLIQYLSPAEFACNLGIWRQRLKPQGHLVLSDVIPPDLGPLDDAFELLSFALRGRFLCDAVNGLIRLFFSDYRSLRSRLGLSVYSESDLSNIADIQCFDISRASENLGHSKKRMTFLATLRAHQI